LKIDLEQESPKSSIVPDAERLAFTPMLFGRHYLRGESLVYRWMETLCNSYNGGYWDYLTLSNGGGYMAPKFDGNVKICVAGNYFDAEMSADAAGVVASMFALNQLANSTRDEEIIERYYALRAYALSHPDSYLIMQAID
jgi:hypothetical protein